MTLYALIDTAQRPGFHLRLQRLGIAYRSLFQGHPERNLPEIAPVLLVLPSSDTDTGRAVCSMIAKLAAEKPAVSHITSDLALAELAAHLRSFHLATLPAKRHMIIRWYDTRVLPAWLEVLDPDQRATFLGGIRGWRYFDRFGDAQEVQVELGEPVDAPLPRPLVLTQPQYDALMQASEADALLVQLNGIIRDEVRRVDARTLYGFVSTQLQASRSHGLGTMSDHVQFVLMALFTHGRFVEHPYISTRLDGHAADDRPFAEWVRTVPEDVFEAGTPLWKRTA